MCDEINKEFEEFQKDLEIRDEHRVELVVFEVDEKIEKELKELKEKEVIL